MKTKINYNFKFSLGDIVVHRTTSTAGYTSDKYLVLSRSLEESPSGIDEKYLVSFVTMGETRRMFLYEQELQLFKEQI